MPLLLARALPALAPAPPARPRRYARPLLALRAAVASIFLGSATSKKRGVSVAMASNHYRADGVRITHNPYAPGMADQYGAPGETDDEGFDPYADTVGPGIYGGIVQRDAEGNVVVGRQYQDHNSRPGPVYAGGGYTDMSIALRKGPAAVQALLDKDPSLANEISTGGATPLHMCGMGRDNSANVELLVSRGAEVDAVDTYGYTPLHRMASNNLPEGARALLKGGASAWASNSHGETPLSVAATSHARDVQRVLEEHMSATQGADLP